MIVARTFGHLTWRQTWNIVHPSFKKKTHFYHMIKVENRNKTLLLVFTWTYQHWEHFPFTASLYLLKVSLTVVIPSNSLTPNLNYLFGQWSIYHWKLFCQTFLINLRTLRFPAHTEKNWKDKVEQNQFSYWVDGRLEHWLGCLCCVS